MKRWVLRSCTIGLVVMALAGCSTWRSVPLTEGIRMIEEGELASALLTTRDGTELVASRPLAQNDSIVWDDGAHGVAYSNVAFIDVKETQAAKSVGLVVGLAVLFIGVFGQFSY